jgi:hypothetical protein
VQEVPPPGPDEETHQLVVYPGVDLRTSIVNCDATL